MRAIGLIGILAVCGAAATADAFVVQQRFTSRVGPGADSTFTVVPSSGLVATPGTTYRVRVQFGVFDDGTSPAPDGGYVGWNVGTQDMNGGPAGTRTNGRIAPFNFAPAPPGNGLPSADPFTALTGIDNTLGTQGTGSPGFPAWICAPDGTFGPAPAAIVRGRNSFVSTWEFTFTAGASNFDALFGGNMVTASGWGTIGTPTPPDCGDPADPSDDMPGSILYAPQTLAPIPAQWTLHVVVPAPGSMALLGLGGLIAGRRRRA